MPVTHEQYTLSVIFTVAVVASIIVQLVVFVFFVLLVSKTLKKLVGAVEALSTKATPLVKTVHDLVEDLTPKIKTISGNVADISATIREQTHHVNTTVDDVVDKTHVQVARVDEMVTAVLASLSHAGAAVQSGVGKPARKVSNVVTGLRAGIDSLFRRSGARSSVPSAYGAASRTAPVGEPIIEEVPLSEVPVTVTEAAAPRYERPA